VLKAIEDQIIEVIQEHQTFLILPHTNIDGDDEGSMLALKLALEKIGKQVSLFCPENLPKVYNFLPAVNNISKVLPPDKVDVAILLECSSPNRLPENFDLSNSAHHIINIDHHIDNKNYAEYNWVNSKAAAVGEMVFQLINALKIPLDFEIAVCLYLAILTDTGAFAYSNVTPLTHKIIAQCLEFPIPVDTINRRVYKEKDFFYLKLLSAVIATLERSADGETAWGFLTLDMLNQVNLKYEDTQNLLEELNQIEGVNILILFKETLKGHTRVSLRSSGWPVNRLAEKFGGGGHLQAAGCNVEMPLQKAQAAVLEELANMKRLGS
jgi:bifunctional oligoribonuclease and PAP phosphatase NrnA